MNYLPISELNIALLDGDRGKHYPHPNELLPEGDCLFLSAENVTPEGFAFHKTLFISNAKDALLKGGALKRNDVVITTRGTLGNVAFFNESVPYHRVRINSGMLILRAGNGIDPEFLYYVLSSRFFKNQICLFKSGSAQPQLPKSDLAKIRIPLPDFETQRKIASLIGAFQRKIAINNKINGCLEAQSTSLVTRFIETSKAELPLSRLLRLDNGFPFKSETYLSAGRYGIVTIKNVQDGLIDYSNMSFIDNLPERMKDCCKLEIGDVLLSLTGNVGRVGIVCKESLLLNQRVAKFSPFDRDLIGFLYFYFRLETTKSLLETIAKGTAQQNLSPVETLEQTICFDHRLLSEDDKQSMLANYRTIVKNTIENLRLTQLRESLLPKLMSGEIDVGSIEIG